MRSKVIRDLLFLVLSVVAAFLIVKVGVVDYALQLSRGAGFLGAVVAGMFFVSIFTAAPAVVMIVELAGEMNLWLLVVFGGLGALLGDLIIFRFIKGELTDNVNLWIEKVKNQGFFSIFKSRYFRWLAFVLGALVIASPLPDELGIAIIGVSKIQMKIFAPLSFVLNGTGILVIALAARAL